MEEYQELGSQVAIFVSHSNPSRSKAQHYEYELSLQSEQVDQSQRQRWHHSEYLYEVVHEFVGVLPRLVHRVPRLFACAAAAADGRQLGGDLVGVEAAL